jgi:hypothetical protein
VAPAAPGKLGTPGIGVVAATAVALVTALGADSGGTLIPLAPGAAPIAARFEADGEAAGASDEAVTACGVALCDGSASAVELCATMVASLAFWRFHQAQRPADWQPARPAIMLAIINV